MTIGAPREGAVVAVVGAFDGYHRDHAHLVSTAHRLAAEQRVPLAAVVIDNPGPRVVLPVERRCRHLREAGAASVAVVDEEVPADELARWEGLATVVGADVSQVAVLAGPSLRGGGSSPATLRAAPTGHGHTVVEVPRVPDASGMVASSERVRDAVAAGDMELAGRLLGRPFSVLREVVVGNQIGRTIGVPTANLAPDPRAVAPARGVYAAIVVLPDGSRWPAAANVGVRPTVDDAGELRIEAHLIGFDGDLYGQEIDVALTTRLRDERRFESLDDLKAQLAMDIRQAADTIAGTT